MSVKTKSLLALFSFVFLFIIAIFFDSYLSDNFEIHQLKKFQNKILQQEKEFDHIQNLLVTNFDNEDLSFLQLHDFFSSNSIEENISIFVFEQDSMIYWNSNSVPVPSFDILNQTVVELENGWYHTNQFKISHRTFVFLALIKSKYNYTNEHLINAFSPVFALPNYFAVNINNQGYKIVDNTGSYLFSLKENSSRPFSGIDITSILFYLLSYLLLIFALHYSHQWFDIISNKHYRYFLIYLDALLLLFLCVYFEYPTVIFESDFFSPHLYASSTILQSLGHLFMYSIAVLIIAVLFYRANTFFSQNSKTIIRIRFFYNRLPIALQIVLPVVILLLNVLLFIGLEYILYSLIYNSNILLQFDSIYDLNFNKIIVLFIVFSLFLSYILFTTRIIDLFVLSLSNRKSLMTYLISTIIAILLGVFYGYPLLYIVIPILFFGLYLLFILEFKHGININSGIILLLFFSIFTVHYFQQGNAEKELENRKILAEKLTADRDPIAESKFDELIIKLVSDTSFIQILNRGIEKPVHDYLMDTYLKGYWKQYEIVTILCKESDSLIVEPDNQTYSCYHYFDDLVSNFGSDTWCENLHLLSNNTGTINYISTHQFGKYRLYIELLKDDIDNDLGYPGLLVDKQIKNNEELKNYAYARYFKSDLIRRYGDYSYPLYDHQYRKNSVPYLSQNEAEYNHLIYCVDDQNTIVISQHNKSIINQIAQFSMVFVLFGFFMLIMLLLIAYPSRLQLLKLSFKNRLQIIIVSTILISFLFVGISSIIYIKRINENKNYSALSEKSHSILIEIENKLSDYEEITPEMTIYVNSLMVKFSNVFFTDINMYGLEGTLIATSRDEIFDSGLISDKMNPDAFNHIAIRKESQFNQEDRIGELRYLSSYIPFKNHYGKVIAYLNLPYFVKQDELKKELSGFISTFLNMYLIIIALSIFVALLWSNYLTTPLRLIKEHLSTISLSKVNKKLYWKREDEIGSLVKAYNQTIDELENSAQMLAQTEREGAWREMAKQVAHEIKNPLTPMKLNIQYLHKAWNDKADNWEERLDKFVQTTINQIDTLSHIASEFSDFAKMPQTNKELLDLNEVVVLTVDLYQDNPSIHFDLKLSNMTPNIVADRQQMIRVFNNLLKNSMHALSDQNDAKIRIKSIVENEAVIIQFFDNGKGIDNSVLDKIFSPNFTTKTSGMGLGLAMIKNIVEDSDGTIWFETQKDEFTEFYLRFPIAK